MPESSVECSPLTYKAVGKHFARKNITMSKHLLNIWVLIIFMMVLPAKGIIGEPVAGTDAFHAHELNKLVRHTEKSHGSFTLNENTNLLIGQNTSLSVLGDLNLHSGIRGDGLLVISGATKNILNANGNSISRLMISNPSGVELAAKVIITGELIIDGGDLILGDHDLVLANPFVRITMEGPGMVAYNGNGRILGQNLHALASPVPQPDRDLGSQLCLEPPIGKTPDLYGTQVVYHIQTKCATTFLSPPTPPPD